MPRIVHFEIHADNPERALEFYTSVFGWSMEKSGEQEYWLTRTGGKDKPGVDGGLLKRRGPAPVDGQAVNAFVCTAEVPNLDEYLKKAAAAGGIIAVPKMPIPTVGWLAYFKDSEGNMFGMMQTDPAAK
jgi:uncharacterized protein